MACSEKNVHSIKNVCQVNKHKSVQRTFLGEQTQKLRLPVFRADNSSIGSFTFEYSILFFRCRVDFMFPPDITPY